MKKPTGNDSKKKLSPRGKRMLNFEKKDKLPLSGKSLYLDIKNQKQARQIKGDLGRLGAAVEEFLSKDINYVITSQPRPKSEKPEKHGQSPDSLAAVSTPSPFNCGPSPLPANGRPSSTVTRGKAMVQQVAASKQTNTVIENAEKWNVRIVGLNVALKWIQKELAKLPVEQKGSKGHDGKKTSNTRVRKLKSPYLKFESVNMQYRAIHQQLDSWPHVNVDTPKGTCPFDGSVMGRGEQSKEERGERMGLYLPEVNFVATPEQKNRLTASEDEEESREKKKGSKQMKSIVGGVRIMTAGDIRRRKEIKRLQERKKGYCECCQIKYDNLDKHLLDDQHKAFIRDKKNYSALDTLIKTGPNEATFLQRVLQNHCSKARGKPSKPNNTRNSEELSVTKCQMSKAEERNDKRLETKITGESDKRKEPLKQVKSASNAKLVETEENDSKVDDIKKDVNVQKLKSSMSLKSRQCKSPDQNKSKPAVKKSPSASQKMNKGEETTKNSGDSLVDKKSRNGSVAGADSKSHDLSKTDGVGDMLESHFVPTRTRNFLFIQHLSPKRVSWARRSLSNGSNDSCVTKKQDTETKHENHSATKERGDTNEDHHNLPQTNNISEINNSQVSETKRKTRSVDVSEKSPTDNKMHTGIQENTCTGTSREFGEKHPENVKSTVSKKECDKSNTYRKNDDSMEDFKSDTQSPRKNLRNRKIIENVETKETGLCNEKKSIVSTRQPKHKQCMDRPTAEESKTPVETTSKENQNLCGEENWKQNHNVKETKEIPSQDREDLPRTRQGKCAPVPQATKSHKDEKCNLVKEADDKKQSVSEDHQQPQRTRHQTCEQMVKTLNSLVNGKIINDQKLNDAPLGGDRRPAADRAVHLIGPSEIASPRKAKQCESKQEIIDKQVLDSKDKSKSSKESSKGLDKHNSSQQEADSLQNNEPQKAATPLKLQEQGSKKRTSELVNKAGFRSREIAIKNGCQILTSPSSIPDREEHLRNANANKEQISNALGINPNIEQVTYFIDKIHRLRCTERRRLSVDSKVQDIYRKGGNQAKLDVPSSECSNVNTNSERERTPSPVFNKSPKLKKKQKAKKEEKKYLNEKDLDVYNISSDEKTDNVKSPVCESPGSGVSNTPRSAKRKRRLSKPMNSTSIASDGAGKNPSMPKSKSRKSSLLMRRLSRQSRVAQLSEQESGKDTVEQSVKPESAMPASGILNDKKWSNKFVAIKKLELKDMTIMSKDDKKVSRVRRHGKKDGRSHVGNEDASKKIMKRTRSTDNVKQNHNQAATHTDTQHSKSFSLTWCHAKGSTPKQKSKKVKLNKSWSLISDRSVQKLFDSESDEEEHFEGFRPEDVAATRSSLGSEISYVETTEIELENDSDHEWTLENDEEELVDEKMKDDEQVAEIIQHNLFSSPGKRSDSSWEEACIEYIESQISFSSKLNSSLLNRSATIRSPYKLSRGQSVTPRKKKDALLQLRKETESTHGIEQFTPKRRKMDVYHKSSSKKTEMGIERVDEDIEFNHLSPQKLKYLTSPKGKQTTAGSADKQCQFIMSSSPVMERILSSSTPCRSRPTKRRLHAADALECLPALSTCNIDNVGTTEVQQNLKRRKVVREVQQKNYNVVRAKRQSKRRCGKSQVIKQPKR